jgi:hypothetical protein
MSVVTNDISCACYNGTINKFVIVRVSRYEIEAEGWIYVLHIGRFYQFLQHSVCDEIIVSLGQYLMVFEKDLVGDAKYILNITKSLPNVVIVRAWHNNADEAVCVEDYFHLLP